MKPFSARIIFATIAASLFLSSISMAAAASEGAGAAAGEGTSADSDSDSDSDSKAEPPTGADGKPLKESAKKFNSGEDTIEKEGPLNGYKYDGGIIYQYDTPDGQKRWVTTFRNESGETKTLEGEMFADGSLCLS